MEQKNSGPIGTFIMGLFFLVAGVALTYFKTWPDFQTAKESLHWPKTTATIDRAQVISSKDSKNKIKYSVDIKYSYQIQGRKFESSQIYKGSEGFSSSSSSDANYYISKYPIGQQVEVSYSPTQVGEAVLEPGVNQNHYIFLGISGLFGIVGFGLILSSLIKFAIFATMAGIFLGTLFKKENKGTKRPPTNPQPQKKYTLSVEEAINLDDEMEKTNKVSAKSSSPTDEPWKYKWIIKTSKKEYGPYSYETLVGLFEEGKVKGEHQCFAQGATQIINISKIVSKRAS